MLMSDLAVKGIKEGATDFIVKPWDNQKLVETLLSAATQAKGGKKKHTKQENNSCNSMYWGESSAMQQLAPAYRESSCHRCQYPHHR